MTERGSMPTPPWHAPVTRRIARVRPGLPTVVALAVGLGAIAAGTRRADVPPLPTIAETAPAPVVAAGPPAASEPEPEPIDDVARRPVRDEHRHGAPRRGEGRPQFVGGPRERRRR